MIELIKNFITAIYSFPELIAWGGYVVLFAIIFSETGLLVGFFLPGDSLLVATGLFAAKGDLNIIYLIILLSIAAILWDSFNYWIGRKAGHSLFHREDSRFFKKKYLLAAQEFYEKHGGKTIILARFVPIIRTFAPTVAGIAEMNYKKFLSFNIFGGVLWVASMLLLGYFLGQLVPNIDKNIDKVIIIVIFVSLIPLIVEYFRQRRKKYVVKHPSEEKLD